MVMLDGGPADTAALRRMTRALRHRGPDDEGMAVDGPVGLGFRRLAILDLSPAGHQPMTSADGMRTIVFNGEIYNYVELRDELRALGHTFRSTGDTEVLLHAYEQWGADCLPRLNGMWAFVIADRSRKVLFGSRDRFGVKPLYYSRTDDCLLMASEIKGILVSGHYTPATNWTTASRYLLQRRLDENDETFYEGIRQIPPGSAFEINRRGDVRQWKFWSLETLPTFPVPDPPKAFASLFADAVRVRMRSDVPVGVCLSGGLDSTSILALAAAQRRSAGVSDPLQAFCYTAPEFDESRYVSDTLAMTGAEVNHVDVTPARLWDNLRRAMWHYDEPVHSPTALIGFELMKLAASRGVKVVLNGQGADETLAGYHVYFTHYWQTLLDQGRVLECWRQMSAFAAAHGGETGPLFRGALRRLATGRVKRSRLAAILAGPAESSGNGHPWFERDLQLPFSDRPLAADAGLDDALRFSTERRNLPLYLRVEDRNSMAHSVEARLPFLDFRLVTLAYSLPANWKMRGPWNKFVLREAMRGRIPESVRARRDKMGFPTSLRRWFQDEWYEATQDLLDSRAVRERGIYRVDAIRRDLERHRLGEVDVSDRLFAIAQFETWSKPSPPAVSSPVLAEVRRA
jgi:asparagine synthase (glutamine-hydrolysing)